MAFGMGDELGQLETALEAGGMAWWIIEMPHGSVFFSHNKTNMLGYKAKDFIHYSHFTALIHKDDYENAMQAMRSHLDGKSPVYETKYRIKCKDGTYKTFYDRGKITGTDKHGNITIAGIVMDITTFSPDKL